MGECSKGDVQLTKLEQAILRVEREWWRVANTRDQAIRTLTALTPTQYYVMLSAMLDSPRVWAADPVLIDRLRHLRDRKLAQRELT